VDRMESIERPIVEITLRPRCRHLCDIVGELRDAERL